MTEERVPVASVVTAKVAVLHPAGTTTLAGTVAFALLELVSATVAPPVGAGPFNVTVAVGLCSRGTLVRSRVTEKAWRDGATVSVAGTDVPPEAAVIATLLLTEAASVVTAKPAEAAPAGTVTLAGTVAAAVFELVRLMTVPPDGAVPFSVTVADDVDDPKAVDGASMTV